MTKILPYNYEKAILSERARLVHEIDLINHEHYETFPELEGSRARLDYVNRLLDAKDGKRV